jgi:high-affinity nickel permease
VLGIMNVFILYKLIKQLQKTINTPANSPEPEFQIEGGGCLFNILKRMFKLIDRYVRFFFFTTLAKVEVRNVKKNANRFKQ